MPHPRPPATFFHFSYTSFNEKKVEGRQRGMLKFLPDGRGAARRATGHGGSGEDFDLFLSYDWRNHASVERIARALTGEGLRVFLDRWYLTPGLPWPQALERSLRRCSAVAVFVGPEGLGPWQLREHYLALDRQTRDSTFPVSPRSCPASGRSGHSRQHSFPTLELDLGEVESSPITLLRAPSL